MKISHDQSVNRLREALLLANPKRITDTFLSGLSSRDMSKRMILGIYAFADRFPMHTYRPSGVLGPDLCEICGEMHEEEVDYNLLSEWEKLQIGGTFNSHPLFMAMLLERMEFQQAYQPTALDYQIFNQILYIIGNCSAHDGRKQLENRLMVVKCLPNAQERHMLVDILGLCGIIQSRNYQEADFADSESMPDLAWFNPADQWTGKDGLSRKNLEKYFGVYHEIGAQKQPGNSSLL